MLISDQMQLVLRDAHQAIGVPSATTPVDMETFAAWPIIVPATMRVSATFHPSYMYNLSINCYRSTEAQSPDSRERRLAS